MEVSQAEAPYLFDAAGKSQWASASAELLASFAALWAFGHLEPKPRVRKIPVAVSGITDNRSNQSLSFKQSSTKWPLMIINMQVSHHLMRAALRLGLTWRPREENTLADDLTNGRFGSFLADRRMHFLFKDLPLELLSISFGRRKASLIVRGRNFRNQIQLQFFRPNGSTIRPLGELSRELEGGHESSHGFSCFPPQTGRFHHLLKK